MNFYTNRRSFVIGGMLAAVGTLSPRAIAQAKVTLLFSDSMNAEDLRAKLLFEKFVPVLGSEFEFKPYFNSTLFKQGAELLAMQRGNLDMCGLSVPDFQRQTPAWGIVGAPYVFRDVVHMQRTFSSDVGRQLFDMAEQQLGIKVLSVSYIGTRHLSLKGKKKVSTPADLAGIKLRMPAGEGWQFLGEALGANPTPIAFAETYLALQTGTVDGQDNPMPLTKTMKFHEVLSQYVLTGHLINCNFFSVSKIKWDTLTSTQRDRLQSASTEYSAAVTARSQQEEQEMAAFFKSHGLDVYTPDVTAFRNYALEKTRNSKYIKEWVPGMLEKINAL